MTDYYNEGYEIGLVWDEDYIPGGPWFCTCSECKKKSHKNEEQWFLGFHTGVEQGWKNL